MIFRLLANTVLVAHLLFIAFVFGGAALAFRHRWVVWLHVPAAIWGGLVEFTGWYCPLTPLEDWLLRQGGGMGYSGGFVETRLLAVIYPEGLTRTVQICLGAAVVLVNAILYYRLFARGRRQDSGARA